MHESNCIAKHKKKIYTKYPSCNKKTNLHALKNKNYGIRGRNLKVALLAFFGIKTNKLRKLQLGK